MGHMRVSKDFFVALQIDFSPPCFLVLTDGDNESTAYFWST